MQPYIIFIYLNFQTLYRFCCNSVHLSPHDHCPGNQAHERMVKNNGFFSMKGSSWECLWNMPWLVGLFTHALLCINIRQLFQKQILNILCKYHYYITISTFFTFLNVWCLSRKVTYCVFLLFRMLLEVLYKKNIISFMEWFFSCSLLTVHKKIILSR